MAPPTPSLSQGYPVLPEAGPIAKARPGGVGSSGLTGAFYATRAAAEGIGVPSEDIKPLIEHTTPRYKQLYDLLRGELELDPQLGQDLPSPVFYTHPTLPTIYPV